MNPPPNRRRTYTGPERRRALLNNQGEQPPGPTPGDAGREAELEHLAKRRRAAERKTELKSKSDPDL